MQSIGLSLNREFLTPFGEFVVTGSMRKQIGFYDTFDQDEIKHYDENVVFD
jgi:hypothetical protein